MPVTDSEIHETYIRYFRELGTTAEATFRTAERLFPQGEARVEGFRRIRALREGWEIEEGDPFRIAVTAAMERLRAEGAFEAVREAWRKAVSAPSVRMTPKEWTPQAMERAVRDAPNSPWLGIAFNEAGSVTSWKVAPARTADPDPEAFRTAMVPVFREVGPQHVKEQVEVALGFVRLRGRRWAARESGHSVPLYPHEVVVDLLPKNAEYVVRWAVPDERARAATEEVFSLPGATGLSKEIEEEHAVMRVPDLAWLLSLLDHLAARGLVSDRLLEDQVLQVATEYWDPSRWRWVAVSEEVAAFDALRPPER